MKNSDFADYGIDKPIKNYLGTKDAIDRFLVALSERGINTATLFVTDEEKESLVQDGVAFAERSVVIMTICGSKLLIQHSAYLKAGPV